MRRRDRHQCPCRRRNHDRSRRSPQPRLPKRAARFPDQQSAMLIGGVFTFRRPVSAPRSLPSGASLSARADSGHGRRSGFDDPGADVASPGLACAPSASVGRTSLLSGSTSAATASSRVGSRRSSASMMTAPGPRGAAQEVSHSRGCCIRTQPAPSCRAYNDRHNSVHHGRPFGKDFSHVGIA
jgi:hypothetical protein